MELLDHPLASAEFLVVDTETNGLGGEQCELTEIGAVLVGGGELHDRWSSLVRTSMPLRRGIQRFTGITQAMVDGAPDLEEVLPQLAGRMSGRVLVAHNAPFDRRVLRQSFERVGLVWPSPPVLCTAALARAVLPLQRERKLTKLADALAIEVELAHRALADAETCARVLCALFPRLCANATTVAEAVSLLGPHRPRRPPRGRTTAMGRGPRSDRARPGLAESGREPSAPELDFADLPGDPGVYLFRDAVGATLYVGKSVSIRSRARAHFAPSSAPAQWTAHATIVDYRATRSELGALVLENRLIKQLKPAGNVRLARQDDRLVYIRCRLDIPFPILEVATEPASGHAVTIGPLRGRRLAQELVEQLDSLFGLRHCGRRLPRREYPSAYGQMGRCLSPCLGDLDPNLYRRRLDAALGLFVQDADGGQALIAHVTAQMQLAAEERAYERAAWLRRRIRRLRSIVEHLGGVLQATHARARLIVARHPSDARQADAFWLVGGRLVDWGPADEPPPADGAPLADRPPCPGDAPAPVSLEARVEALAARTQAALARGGRASVHAVGTHVPPDEVDEVRIIGGWLASHPEAEQLVLDPLPTRDQLAALAAGLGALSGGTATRRPPRARRARPPKPRIPAAPRAG